MRICTPKNTLSALKVNDVDAKELSEKFEILNDNLKKSSRKIPKKNIRVKSMRKNLWLHHDILNNKKRDI